MAINVLYDGLIENIRAALDRDGAVLLQEFLDKVPSVRDGKRVSVPDKCSYLQCSVPDHIVTGIQEFVHSLFPLSIVSVKAQQFLKGDYTLLHDDNQSFNGVTVLYDVADATGGRCVFHNDKEEFGFLGVKNTCVIVRGNYRHYFKYVNHTQTPRTVLMVQFQ